MRLRAKETGSSKTIRNGRHFQKYWEYENIPYSYHVNPSGRLTKTPGEFGKSGRKLGKAVEGLVEGCTTEKGQVTK